MWTYMMAAARGDRASSMMSRRRNESESPKYGYNLSRPMYRTTRLNGPNATSSAGSYQYPGSTYGSSSSTSASQMFHTSTYQLQQHQLHQQQQLQQHQRLQRAAAADRNDDDYQQLAASAADDSTSLFSPLPTTTATVTGGNEAETCLFQCKNTTASGKRQMRKHHLIANHVGESKTGASVAHIHTNDSDEEYHQGAMALQRHIERQSKGDQNEDDDEDEVEHGDDEEEDYLEGVIENGKRMSQDYLLLGTGTYKCMDIAEIMQQTSSRVRQELVILSATLPVEVSTNA